jgi:hypothetical protein
LAVGGGGGSTVAAASLAAEAAAWQKRDFSRSSSAFEMRRQRGGGGGNNSALAAAAWCMLIIILIVTMMMIIDRGGGKGVGKVWLQASLVVVAMDGDDNRNGDCLSKKGVGQGKRRKGIERWVSFFHAVLFCYCFLAYIFQCRSIDFCRCRCVLLLPSW